MNKKSTSKKRLVVARKVEPVVRFLCRKRLPWLKAVATLDICKKFGRCGEIENTGGRFEFDFRQHKNAPETIVAWLIMLCSLEVADRKSNPAIQTRRDD